MTAQIHILGSRKKIATYSRAEKHLDSHTFKQNNLTPLIESSESDENEDHSCAHGKAQATASQKQQ